MIILYNVIETGRGPGPTVDHWSNAENNEKVIWRSGGPKGIELKFKQARKFGCRHAGIEFIISSYEKLDWETCNARVLSKLQDEFPKLDWSDPDIAEHFHERADPMAAGNHVHVFTRAFNEDTGRPIHVSHPFPRVEKVCRLVEYDENFAFVRGPNTENIIARLPGEGRADVADALRAAFPADNKKVGGNSFSPAVRQQVKRTVKQHYKSITAVSSDPKATLTALVKALVPEGIAIAVGPYVPKPRFIVMKDGQMIGKLAGVTGDTILAVEAKLGDPDVSREIIAAAESNRRSEGVPGRAGSDDPGTAIAPVVDGGDRAAPVESDAESRRSRAAAFITELRKHGKQVADVSAAAIAAAVDEPVRFDIRINEIETDAKRAIRTCDTFQHPESLILTAARTELKGAKEDHSKVVDNLKRKQERLERLESLPVPSFFRFIKRMKHRKEVAKARDAVDVVDAKSKVTYAAVEAANSRLFGWKLIHDDNAAKAKAPLEQVAKTAKRNLRICDRARAMVKEDPLLLRFSGPGVYALAEKSIDADDNLEITFVDGTGLTTPSWKI